MSNTSTTAVSLVNLLRVPEIRTRILIALGLLFIYRIGFFIPLPGVDLAQFLERAQSGGDAGGLGRLVGMVNVLTGASLQQAAVFSLGVMPYISSSIIFSLLTKVVPTLEKLSKEGPSGQKKINQYTRLATVPICVVQSMFIVFGFLRPNIGTTESLLYAEVADYFGLYMIVVVLALTAGTLFIMWLGEQITEHGIGNGISLIIMAGIVADLLPAFLRMLQANTSGSDDDRFQLVLLFLLAWGVAVFAVVYMTKAQRRIPIQQAKQTRGRRVYGGQRHYLPLKVNHAGVMPIIFASALLIVPTVIGQVTNWGWLQDAFNPTGAGFWYITVYAGLIFFFAFFWTSLMFKPNEMADNLKEYGSFIPGIRPGKNTAKFLESTMVRITLAGGSFLALIAVFPTLVSGQFQGLDVTLLYFMSGTSILIVVSVALDLVEKLNGMLIMRNYEGFMKDTSGRAAAAGWGRQTR